MGKLFLHRSHWLLLAALALSFACTATLDGSSEATWKTSLQEMKSGLTPRDQERLVESLQLLVLGEGSGFSLLQLASGSEQILADARRRMDGKTFDEILGQAEALRAAKATRQRSNAFEKIAALRAKRTASRAALDVLENFKVLSSRFSFHQEVIKSHFIGDRYGPRRPRIELEVRNNTAIPVAQAQFHGTISSPGRTVPWLSETFTHRISGGIEPGETARWTLEPNMFGPWSEVQLRDDMVLDIVATGLFNVAGQPLVEATFTENDARTLAALVAEYDTPSSD